MYRAIRRARWFAALSVLIAAPVLAQTQDSGRIIGRVIDASTGGPVRGAQVVLTDGEAGVLTDLDGRYVLPTPPSGSVSITVQYLGYGTKTVTGVQLGEGGVVTLDVTLERQAIEVGAIVITAEAEEGSQVFLLDQRRTATPLIEGIGSVEIGRRGDSDAAQVAQRMTGVTVSEGKYVYVRGLGERYAQTQLNGSSLPSPEPEREVVPLDLFPSGFLESLETQKSYTPDLPADFSGGSVKIKTKDFPSQFTVRAGIGTSFNTESQFEGDFLSYTGGDRDFLGFDDGTRDQPKTLRAVLGDIDSGKRLPSDPGQLVDIGESLRGLGQGFSPVPKDTPLNRSFNLSVGGRDDVFDDGEFGYFVAGSYSDDYALRSNEIERKWLVSAFNPNIAAEVRRPNVDYSFTRGTRNVAWGVIGNLTVKPSPDQKLSLRTTVNVNTEDEARLYQGDNREDIGGVVRAERLRFVSRLMLWGQLSGEHQLFDRSRLEWRASAARASRDEPLLRESVYLADDDESPFYLLPIGESGRYLWSELYDDDFSAAADWTFPFALLAGEASIKVGSEYRTRIRDFAARRLNWDFIGGYITSLDGALQSGQVVSTVRNTGQFAIRDVVEPGDLYGAEDTRTAGYGMLDLPVTESLQAILGARVEHYALNLDSRGQTLQDFDRTDLAPSVNLILSISNAFRLRGAISRTVDRPEFRELAPFQFTEATSLRQLYGNPDLEPATIFSADLRLDCFPYLNELVSIGGFYKRLTDPIEQVFIAAASTAYSFQNARSADIYGLELDTQLGLGRLSRALQLFSLQANYSLIESDVSVREGSTYHPTNLNRPLQGQASYVLNAGVGWANPSGYEAGLYFNRFGRRLEAAGGGGIPDLYEIPRNALDATVRFPIRGGASARIRATNLLDSDYRYEQRANGITQIQRLYSVGQTFSVGLSWEF